jgi:hypothetical protein
MSISTHTTVWVRGECSACGHDITTRVDQSETGAGGANVKCGVCEHINWLTTFGTAKQTFGEADNS